MRGGPPKFLPVPTCLSEASRRVRQWRTQTARGSGRRLMSAAMCTQDRSQVSEQLSLCLRTARRLQGGPKQATVIDPIPLKTRILEHGTYPIRGGVVVPWVSHEQAISPVVGIPKAPKPRLVPVVGTNECTRLSHAPPQGLTERRLSDLALAQAPSPRVSPDRTECLTSKLLQSPAWQQLSFV